MVESLREKLSISTNKYNINSSCQSNKRLSSYSKLDLASKGDATLKNYEVHWDIKGSRCQWPFMTFLKDGTNVLGKSVKRPYNMFIATGGFDVCTVNWPK